LILIFKVAFGKEREAEAANARLQAMMLRFQDQFGQFGDKKNHFGDFQDQFSQFGDKKNHFGVKQDQFAQFGDKKNHFGDKQKEYESS
jgi:hypothetical protein